MNDLYSFKAVLFKTGVLAALDEKLAFTVSFVLYNVLDEGFLLESVFYW